MPQYPGLEQLICVALANHRLASALITNPATALRALPPPVQLSPAERALVVSIRSATDIHDFAAQLLDKVREQVRSATPGQRHADTDL